jgi:hypothetical protein
MSPDWECTAPEFQEETAPVKTLAPELRFTTVNDVPGSNVDGEPTPETGRAKTATLAALGR